MISAKRITDTCDQGTFDLRLRTSLRNGSIFRSFYVISGQIIACSILLLCNQ
jgi:hypothetical protein